MSQEPRDLQESGIPHTDDDALAELIPTSEPPAGSAGADETDRGVHPADQSPDAGEVKSAETPRPSEGY